MNQTTVMRLSTSIHFTTTLLFSVLQTQDENIVPHTNPHLYFTHYKNSPTFHLLMSITQSKQPKKYMRMKNEKYGLIKYNIHNQADIDKQELHITSFHHPHISQGTQH